MDSKKHLFKWLPMADINCEEWSEVRCDSPQTHASWLPAVQRMWVALSVGNCTDLHMEMIMNRYHLKYITSKYFKYIYGIKDMIPNFWLIFL